MNAPLDSPLLEDAPPGTVVLQKLSPRHMQAMALLAQGIDRRSIAQLLDYTPEYITWLSRQDVCRQYLQEMSEHVGVRLEALFEKSVDVIANAMSNGSTDDQLKAARLQMEATKRIGRNTGDGTDPRGGDDRLEVLANRLVGLLRTKRQEVTYEGEAHDVEDASYADGQPRQVSLPSSNISKGASVG